MGRGARRASIFPFPTESDDQIRSRPPSRSPSCCSPSKRTGSEAAPSAGLPFIELGAGGMGGCGLPPRVVPAGKATGAGRERMASRSVRVQKPRQNRDYMKWVFLGETSLAYTRSKPLNRSMAATRVNVICWSLTETKRFSRTTKPFWKSSRSWASTQSIFSKSHSWVTI